MKQYINFSIELTTDDETIKAVYNDFKCKYKNFLIDEDMELYRIPYETKEYFEISDIAERYYWDWNSAEDRDDFPGFYVDKGQLITEYSNEDYDRAVAYIVNFNKILYQYDSVNDFDFVGDCCDVPSWKIAKCVVQDKNYILPKKEVKKKKYASCTFGYFLSEEVVCQLLNEHLAEKEDFKIITDIKGEKIGYQLMPENAIDVFMEGFNITEVDFCRNCGVKRFFMGNEPYFIGESCINKLKGINRTKELFGSVPEEYENQSSNPVLLTPKYIIDKKTYEFLKGKYDKMEFIPVFFHDK